MNIQRDYYLKQLIAGRGNGLIKIITGIRRCGKSYLLFKLFHEWLNANGIDDGHIIEIALDDRGNKPLRDPDNLLAHIKSQIKDKSPYYILLDEIQIVPEFTDVLNSLLHISNADVYVTGSNSHFLSTDVVTEFRGRGDEIRLHPLSFSEYCQGFQGERDKAWRGYYTYGGLPLILSLDTEQKKADYLTNLYESVYLVDILERHNIKNRGEFDELVKIMASSIGNHIMENIIYNELRIRGYRVDVGMIEQRERDKNGNQIRKQYEVDFVANQGSKRYYIQSAFALPDEAKIRQETASLIRIDDSFKKIIVVRDDIMPKRDDNGIMTIGIIDFLLRSDSLDY